MRFVGAHFLKQHAGDRTMHGSERDFMSTQTAPEQREILIESKMSKANEKPKRWPQSSATSA